MSGNGPPKRGRSYNAEMAAAASGALLGARRVRNSRLFEFLLEAEKADELEQLAARAPVPDSPAVVAFKTKMQAQRDAADAARARDAANAAANNQAQAAALEQASNNLKHANFTPWPIPTTGAGPWISIFGEPGLSFNDERYFRCCLPGSHEHAFLINCNKTPSTSNFQGHIDKYHKNVEVLHNGVSATIGDLFDSATRRGVADDVKSAAIASLQAASVAREASIGMRFDAPPAARALTTPRTPGAKKQTRIDFNKSGTALQQQARRLQIRWCFAQLSTRTPWGIVNDPAWRHAIDMGSSEPPSMVALSTPVAAAAAGAVNDKALRTETLERIYAFVKMRLCEDVGTAPAFSIGYDVWTNRGLRAAFVGIMAFYVTADLQPRSALLGVVEITTSHTKEHIARVVAAVVNEVTTEHQHIYGTQTDTAANVRAAARLLLENVNAASQLPIEDELGDAVNGAELEVLDLDPQASDLFGDGVGNDNGGGDDDDDLDLEQLGVAPDADLQVHEDMRVQRCFEHVADLITKDAVKSVAKLKEAVRHVDELVAVFGRSEQRKRLLAKINKVLKPDVPARPMKRRVITRWHVLSKCIRRLLENAEAIGIMFELGMFKGVRNGQRSIKRPNQYDLIDLAAVADLLDLINAAGRPLEGSEYFTLPFVSVISHHLILRLSAPHANEEHRPVIKDTREALLASATRRLSPYLNANAPTMLACLLHPLTSSFYAAIVTKDDGDVDGGIALGMSRNVLAEWYSELAQSALDKEVNDLAAAGGPLPPAKARRADELPAAAVGERAAEQLRLLEALDGAADQAGADADQDARQIAIDREEARGKLKVEGKAAVTTLLRLMLGPTVAAQFPFPHDLLDKTNEQARDERTRGENCNAMAKANNSVLKFYTSAEFTAAFPDQTRRDRLIVLVRCIMSSPATNASGESAFSLAGLIDSPLRNRIAPTTFNKMMVASYEVIRQKNTDPAALKRFIEDCVRANTLN
jgi:hypothetical protein